MSIRFTLGDDNNMQVDSMQNDENSEKNTCF